MLASRTLNSYISYYAVQLCLCGDGIALANIPQARGTEAAEAELDPLFMAHYDLYAAADIMMSQRVFPDLINNIHYVLRQGSCLFFFVFSSPLT